MNDVTKDFYLINALNTFN